jgi:hypothetical protein
MTNSASSTAPTIPFGLRALTLLILLLVLSGCYPRGRSLLDPTRTPLPDMVVPQFIPTQPEGIENTNDSQPAKNAAPVPSETVVLPATAVQGPLSVIITAPGDQVTVTSSTVEIIGQANPGTIILVNGELVLVGDNRDFSIPVLLNPGMNRIEITASDFENEPEQAYITVFYQTD